MSHLFENEDTEVSVKSAVSRSTEAVLVESLGPHVKGTGPSQAMMLIRLFFKTVISPFHPSDPQPRPLSCTPLSGHFLSCPVTMCCLGECANRVFLNSLSALVQGTHWFMLAFCPRGLHITTLGHAQPRALEHTLRSILAVLTYLSVNFSFPLWCQPLRLLFSIINIHEE